MWQRAVAGARPSTRCRSATSPTACTCRPGSGAPMRELLDRHLGEGWSTRAAEPDTWAAVDRIPDEELWEARERQRAELVEFVRARSAADRLAARRRRASTSTRPPTAFDPRRADDRLRAPRRDLQAARPADPRPRVDAVAARRRATRAGRARRQGASARRGGQARAPAPVRAEGGGRSSAQRVVFLDDYDLATGGVARARLRRVAEPAAPAARGERHERDEVGDQRRPAAERARRLVGRGATTATTAGRSPARSTTTIDAQDDARRRRRSTACSTTRCCPAFYERDKRRLAAALARADPGVAADARAAIQRDPDAVGVLSAGRTGGPEPAARDSRIRGLGAGVFKLNVVR